MRVLSSSALSAAAASFRLLMCEDADPRPCSLSFTIVLSRVTCAHSQTGNGCCLLGGGFFLTSENSEGRFKDSFPARTSCFFTLFSFKVEISSHTPIPLYGPGSIHSGSASWDDCEQVFPDDLHVSPFSGQASTLCLNSIISPLRSQHSQPTPLKSEWDCLPTCLLVCMFLSIPRLKYPEVH